MKITSAIHQNFRKEIHSYLELDDEDWNLLLSGFQAQRLNKGEIFTKVGAPEDKVGYIVEGSMRAFIMVEGKEVNHDLFRSGNFVAELDSFISGNPSDSTIIANDDVEMVVIHKNELNNFCSQSESIESLVRIVFEMIHNKKREQEIVLRIAAAGDKLRYMKREKPELFNYFKKKEIASYLNITPETFSRLGKNGSPDELTGTEDENQKE